MSTIAYSGCKIQVIFAASNKFGNILTTYQGRPDGAHVCGNGHITFTNYEIIRGRAIVVDQEDIYI